ncbi:MAG: 30S ribosomal protein S6 [Candidatus Aenigmatarchaeota archaeon]
MKLYDLTFWISINEESKKIEEKILNLIGNLGGKVELVIQSKKRALAYPIMKETHGYLGTIYFSAEPQITEKIYEELKKVQGILRFLIVKRKSLPKTSISVNELGDEEKIENSSLKNELK